MIMGPLVISFLMLLVLSYNNNNKNAVHSFQPAARNRTSGSVMTMTTAQVVPPPPPVPHTIMMDHHQKNPIVVPSSRRQLLSMTGIGAWTFLFVQPACSVEDLAMPTTPDDAPKNESDAAMEERLRRKAELQRKMTNPKTFNESLKNEWMKQGDLNSRSKEERRNAMCEELGRGC